MDTGQIVSSIIVSLIALVSGWLAARASAKASTTNVVTSSRVEMEKEAYERARKLDTETIQRQDQELEELYQKVDTQSNDIQQLHHANNELRRDNDLILADNRRLQDEMWSLRREFTVLRTEVQTNPMLRRPPSNGRE
jgi:peptidoglycan hydrolase CwlO-like protein